MMGFPGKEIVEDHGSGYGGQHGTHYDVLRVLPSSSLAEIRANYRAALLALHPDKLSSCVPSHSREEILQELHSLSPGFSSNRDEELVAAAGNDMSRYLRVQVAWDVLRDSRSRAAYDALLSTQLRENLSPRDESHRVICEEVTLEEMEEGSEDELGSSEYYYSCRCSDFFVVSQRELQEAGLESEGEHVDRNMHGTNVAECGDDRGGLFGRREEGDCAEGIEWGRQRRSIVLPCQSCSLHLRVYFWAACP